MLIHEWMSKNVIIIDHDKSLNDAAKIFETHVISMLPVLEKGKLIGVVTDGDIKKALPSAATTLDRFEMASRLDSVNIESVMSTPVITIRPEYTVNEAADIMLGNGISGLPVRDRSGKLSGVITKSDIFRCFVSFTGVARDIQIFAFKLNDKPGLIKYVTDIIRDSGGRLCSIMTSYDDIEDGYRKVFFHVFGIETGKFETLCAKFEKSGELLYVADQAEGIRKIIK